jgi:hypothetical protein
MGDLRQHPPSLLLTAVITRYDSALAWARERCTAEWGPTALESPTFPFVETNYYEPTMGPNLGTTFLTFERPYDPADTATTKLATNAWEAEYAALGRHPESRPLNLDPGYLTAAKLVLSSTKDHTHRIYLGQGIYGEITLFYRHGAWRDHEFTFPNYRRADYQQFFTACRGRLQKHS